MYTWIVNTKKMECLQNLAILIGAIVLFILPVKAHAVQCGDVITTSTSLTGDLNCATNPALTVEGPGKLNLREFTVSCDNFANTGIFMTGTRATVQNGTVTGCQDGVFVQGIGDHRVQKIKAEGNEDDGIDVVSDNNHIVKNETIDNQDDGIELDGDNNHAVNNFVSGSGDEGIEVDGDGNSITKNTVVDTENDGICVDGEENRITRNNVSQSGDNGIEIDEDGGNRVTGNRSDDNVDSGIAVFEGSENNHLSGNKASGNGEFDFKDLNVDCDNNRWTGNTGLANIFCIR